MSHRTRRRGPWWGLVLLGGCLNPQPDTNPLSPEANGAPVVDTLPPASPPMPAGGAAPAANSNPEDRSPEGLLAGEPDAGAPPQPDAGAPQDRIPVTFSATDAGLLQPDAGPSGED